MKSIILPKFGFTLEESEIMAWIVSPGDYVESGDPIAEVSTDKVDMEIEAPSNGYLAAIRYNVGDVVPVTEVIALLAENEEELKQIEAQGDSAFGPETATSTSTTVEPSTSAELPAVTATASGVGKPGNATPVARRMAQEAGIDIGQVTSGRGDGKIRKEDVVAFMDSGTLAPSMAAATNGKVRATPAARHLASERGIALGDIAGSGPRGRVQAADVSGFTEQQLSNLGQAQQPPPTGISAPHGIADSGQYVLPMSKMRRAIASNLQSSWQTIPHIMFSVDMVLDNLLALCARHDNVGLNAAMIKTVAWALTRHPRLNAHLVNDELIQHGDVHIGMAVALDEGLIVPVVRHAHTKGLAQLTEESRAIAQRARENSLRPADMGGATFSISNLGMYGIDSFTSIINPPEVGILAIGSKRRTLTLDEADQPIPRSVATFTLSVDHRAIDGAVAAQFMADLRLAIEAPDRMLL